MTDSETVVAVHKTYHDYHITVDVTAEPPLPHDDADDGDLRADLAVYDGPPPGSSTPIVMEGDFVFSITHGVTTENLRESVQVMVENAKDRIDERHEQAASIKADVAGAVVAELGDDEGDLDD